MDYLSDKALWIWLKDRWAWLWKTSTWKQRQAPLPWAKAWAHNGVRTAIYLFSVLGLTAVIWLLAYVSIEAWGNYQIAKTGEKTLESFRNLMLGLGALVIGPLGFGLAAVRTVSTWKQARIADQKLQTETFSNAIDQLAHKDMPVRLGAIYALEGLARNSPQLHDSVFEALCAYVRNESPWPSDDEKNKNRGIRADIQTILTIIGRRDQGNESHQTIVDLSSTDLRQANLEKGHFEGINLAHAHLEGANLAEVHLQGANLREAHLENAVSRWAHLEGAILTDAHLEGAELTEVRLDKALLFGIRLEGANLTESRLYQAVLWGAHLERADLSGAHFKGADLAHANFNARTCVNLADFRGAQNIPLGFRETVQSDTRTQWPPYIDIGAWEGAEDDESV